jgi:hypothetical protein
MRKIRFFFTLGFVCLLALPLLAQEKPGNVVGAWYVKPKPGMQQQFEQALKRHMEWHKQQKDTWAIYVEQALVGDRPGLYEIAVAGHHWKDFDGRTKFNEADDADFYANVAQYVDLVGSSFWIHHPELSRPMTGDAPFAEYVEEHLNLDGESDYLLVLRKVREAVQKGDYPVYWEVYELYNGGEHPTYGIVFPHKTWADFEPPEQPLTAVLEKAYGRDEADALWKMLFKSVHSVKSEVWASRPDLGYVPAAK